ncbi:hypothetical protein P8452_73258 [Trifolium repens]|nr:hypothetical protein QL285_048146 [Trifolium repens]WJX91487.1 hypothetical protein P8452_73258 [Trifolium repens]
MVPVKVSVFAWRFMENWIPARDNLFKRGILNFDAQHRVLGCGSNESLSRLFFACAMSHKYKKCFQVCQKKKKKCFQVVWLATIWIIWKARNGCYSNNKTFDVSSVVLQTFDEVQRFRLCV